MKTIREAADQDLQWRDKKVGLFVADEFELRSLADVEAVLSPVEAPARLIETVAHAQ